jgi:hypothetical protein
VTSREIDVRELVGRTLEGLEALARGLAARGERGVAAAAPRVRAGGTGRPLRVRRRRPRRERGAAAAAWRAPPHGRGRM